MIPAAVEFKPFTKLHWSHCRIAMRWGCGSRQNSATMEWKRTLCRIYPTDLRLNGRYVLEGWCLLPAWSWRVIV